MKQKHLGIVFTILILLVIQGCTTSKEKEATITRVTVAPKTANVEVGKKVTLVETVEGGNLTDNDKGVTWTSSKITVATVSDTGIVTGIAEGSAVITATSTLDNSKSDTATITVKSASSGKLNLDSKGVLILKPSDFKDSKVTVNLTALTAGESVAVIPVQANQRIHDTNATAPGLDYNITSTGIEGTASNTPILSAGLVRTKPKFNTSSISPQQTFGDVCPGPYTVDTTNCTFKVFKQDDDQTENVGATLKKETANAYWFFDDSSFTEFTTEDLNKLGTIFENNVVGVVQSNFGNFADVDNNGKIFIIFTALAKGTDGYVNGDDYFEDEGGPPSNEGDIFYATVPSVGSGQGTDRTRKDFLDIQLPATMVHELKHLVANGVRLTSSNPNPVDEVGWIEEASAVASEQLSIFTVDKSKFAQDAAATALQDTQSYRIVFPDSDDKSLEFENNSAYGYGFLFLWRIAERLGHKDAGNTFWKDWTLGTDDNGIPAALNSIANLEKYTPASLGTFEDMMMDFAITLMFDHTNLDLGTATPNFYDYKDINIQDGTWQKIPYKALDASISDTTKSTAYYVGKGKNGDAMIEFSSSNSTPYVAIIRFTGQLPY